MLNLWLTDSEGTHWYNLLTKKLAKPVDKTLKFLLKMII
ncbi:MAG: hypothetical protein SCARUB_01760 [Candidatus Scalindua rubra]|uniref:Uncharacterized protein n=1 Tax=Candidatus Scalindua rubra TaxID=1872076 RepID=A0A1E3XBY6_9BACT|nr:MAG: hypothetical protein SCARUB_01760 [Candidatus Scalindua rubra]